MNKKLHLLSWKVGGIRAAMAKRAIRKYMKEGVEKRMQEYYDSDEFWDEMWGMLINGDQGVQPSITPNQPNMWDALVKARENAVAAPGVAGYIAVPKSWLEQVSYPIQLSDGRIIEVGKGMMDEMKKAAEKTRNNE